MTKTLALALVLVTSSAAGTQEDPLAHIGLVGIGGMNCNQVVAHHRKNQSEKNKTTYLTWAQGFMSGLNRGYDWLHKPAKNVEAWSLQAQMAHLMAFCDKNPSKPFVTAVFDLFYAIPEVIDRSVTGYPVSN